ncbi:hypothetical protein AX16_010341 [Volvariella volvacea WC 439]|nr:hypothetical protein AX16_010341 [Volvariella volvacea WC 439]
MAGVTSTSVNSSAKDLVQIGDGIYLKNGSPSISEGEPRLIVMFGWMGAQLLHLQKYTSVYQKIYPNTTIALVRCPPLLFWIPERIRMRKLEPLLEIIKSVGKSTSNGNPSEAGNILIHTFSNGGSFQLANLNKLFASRWPTLQIQITSSAIIFDSCPGDGGLSSAKRAFGALVRNPILRQFIYVAMTLVHYIGYLLSLIGLLPKATPLQRLMERLNTPSDGTPAVIPWMTKATPRLYLYSKKDHLVPWTDIERHAAQAEGVRGFKHVTLRRFEDSPHVAHARSYPDEYWGAVQQHWKFAQSQSPL